MNRKWLSITLAAALSVTLILAACAGSPPPSGQSDGQTGGQPSGAAGDSAPTQTASTGRSLIIVAVDGVVDVKRAGQSDFSEAEEEQTLNPGDEIQTGPNGNAILLLDDGTQMVLSPNSSFSLAELGGTPDDPISRFLLNAGQLFAVHTGELTPDAKFEIETPSGVAAIRGSYLGVVYFPGAQKGTVICLTGRCTFSPSGGGPIEMTGNLGLRFDEQGVDSELFELTVIHLELWADVLELLETVDFGDKGTVVECNCDGTSLACDDDSVYEEFPSCMPVSQADNSVCWCEGTSMVCEDGSIYPDDGTCAGGNEDYCVCDGTTSFCLDGSVFEGDPICSPENACYCEGTDLACGGSISFNDPVCSGYAFVCLDTVCGDLYCDGLCGETNETCPDDCAVVADCSASRCGDNVCELECGEDAASCSQDCGAACDTAVCGDGICDDSCGEDSASCSDDCADACAEATCGDGVCDASCDEDASWCADCGEQDPCAGVTCGDSSCDAACGEDTSTCSFDCGEPDACASATCGDGTCDSACDEDSGSCSEDCSTGGTDGGDDGGDPCAGTTCGDGSCDSACGEDSGSCSEDCGSLIVLPFPDMIEPEPVCKVY